MTAAIVIGTVVSAVWALAKGRRRRALFFQLGGAELRSALRRRR